MSRLVVLAFRNETGAAGMRQALARLRRQHLIHLAEPAVVVRRQDGEVMIKPTIGLVGPGALLGAFWGVMVGLLFSMPWLGLGLGAAAGAIIGQLADVGVGDRFIKEVGHSVEPGYSALLLLAHDWTDDQVLENEISPYEGLVLPVSPSTWDETEPGPTSDARE